MPVRRRPPEIAVHPGRHDGEILRMAVPALGALIAEPLFLVVDAAIVAHLGDAPLAGLAAAGAILSTLVSVCIFLAYGTTGAVARLLGAGRPAEAVQQGFNGLWLAGLLGAALLVCVPFAPAILRGLGTTADALPYAVTYLRIAALGLPAMLVVLAATGVLRGLRRMRSMLVVAAAGALVNGVLNYLLVFPAGMGIAGSAWGTVLTQYGMAAVLVALILRDARGYRVPAWPRWRGIRDAGTGSTALFVRTVALRIYLLAAVWVAGSLGTPALGAHGLATNLWNLLALALDALAIAGQGIVARHLGAGDAAAARAVTRRLTWWGAGAGVLTAVVLLAAHEPIAHLLSPEPDTRRLLGPVLVVMALLQPVSGVVFALDGVLIGAGDGRYLAIAGVVTTASFIAAAGLVVVFDGGLTALWWAVGFFMLTRLAFLAGRARSSAWLVLGPGS